MNHLNETQFHEYLDDALNESDRQLVDIHLAVCDACQARLAELEQLYAALIDLPDVSLTRDLTPDVLAHLPKAREKSALWRQPAFIIQSLLTVILFAGSMPMLRMLAQKVAKWEVEIVLPSIHFPSQSEMLSQLLALLAWDPQLAHIFPDLPKPSTLFLNPDTNILLMLVISAVLLWIVGNITLLWSKRER